MNQDGEVLFRPPSDVSAQRVARVYAEALVDAAEERGQVDAVLEEYDSLIHEVFRADPMFEAFLASAAVGREHKKEVLRKVFEHRASELFFNFLMVVNQHERLELLRLILQACQALRDQRARRIHVQVRSAVPLADDQRQALEQIVRESFQLEPVVELQVDPEILGGVVVRVGDWLFDGSVKNRLETLR
jgi:F-type H+-transporting ATPase subunit delta